VSIFSWFFSKGTAPKTSDSSGHDTKVFTSISSVNPTSPDSLSQLKQQRHVRREQLYDVVRSVMLRSKVQASHYKFKGLSLDTRGCQFLVMVDLLGEDVLSSERWAPVEQLVTSIAQQQDLQVKAVYWRLMPSAAGETASTPAAPVVASASVAPTPAKVSAATLIPGRGDFDPIERDEVLAFKRAIADAMPEKDTPAQVPEEVVTSGPRHTQPASPAYEDTQLLEPENGGSPLSRTQFGGL
jgi:hypothetical protein